MFHHHAKLSLSVSMTVEASHHQWKMVFTIDEWCCRDLDWMPPNVRKLSLNKEGRAGPSESMLPDSRSIHLLRITVRKLALEEKREGVMIPFLVRLCSPSS